MSMQIRFYIDPETDRPHLHRHGVREEEAEDVLRAPLEDGPDAMVPGSPLAKPGPGGIFE